jgi:hypothetical protein
MEIPHAKLLTLSLYRGFSGSGFTWHIQQVMGNGGAA